MLVRCISNDVRSVDADSALGLELGRWFGVDSQIMDLEVGGLYVVYGVQVKDGWLRYFVADEVHSSTLYPVAYFATFFDVVDQRLSRCWTLGRRSAAERTNELLITFDEWAVDPAFYERLVDGDDREQCTFQARKEFMDLEYPNPSIGHAAELVDEGWLLCPKCGDAWESHSAYGMVRCPKCSALLSNPRHR